MTRTADGAIVVGLFGSSPEGGPCRDAAELRRLLAGLGLRAEEIDHPLAARCADAVVSLPYARPAAADIASRLGARLVETGLPFGIAGTTRWIEEVAAATGCAQRAAAFVSSELDDLIPRVEPAIAHVLRGRSAAFVGEPCFLEGWRGLGTEIGLRLDAADGGADMRARWESLRERGTDLLIAPGDVLAVACPGAAGVEFDFPSRRRCSLRDAPYLGYRGAAVLLERLANAVERSEGERCRRS
ncbi:MAG: hypothetical protein HKL90_09890 [Elusimicrobia bacterium]|nr:hypothetical protein [Elusimicrobiota bacterium]